MVLSEKELRVLLIEHSPDDFLLIKNYLDEGTTHALVYHVKTLAESKERLTSGTVYDVILLNPKLPDSEGEELVRKIVDLAQDVPVIILAGYLDKDLGVHSLSLGVVDYLFKEELTSQQLFKSITYSEERKRINLWLRNSEKNYRNLFNFNPLPTWVYDIETYQFLNVNEAAIKHYGYSRSEFLGMTIMDIRPKEDVKMVEDLVKSRKKTGGFSFGSYRHKKKNGEVFYVDIQSNLIEFNGKNGRLVIASDISERINYTKAIEDQNKLLREIAWTQSHEVRAPLARMLGLIDILKKGPDKDSNEEILQRILNTAHELDTIIKDIVKKTYVVDGLDEGTSLE